MGASAMRHMATFGTVGSVGVLLGTQLSWDGTARPWLIAVCGVAIIATVATLALVCTWRTRAGSRARPCTPPAARAAPSVAGQPDALTGLASRHALLQRLESDLRGQRHGERMTAVLVLDLADFGAINADLGCAAGDLLLRHTGARLLARLRDRDLLARLGGDQFAVVQGGIGDATHAAALAERLLAAFEQPFDLYGHSTRVGARLGIAVAPVDGHEADQLVEQAVQALARARADQPGTLCFFREAMEREVSQRRALGSELDRAIERDQLRLYCQPRIDLRTRRIIGVEAMGCWHHAQHGDLPHDRLMALAEEADAAWPIGAWVLEQVCARAAQWQRAGASELGVTVSLPAAQFRRGDVAELVREILDRTALAASNLELAITEQILLDGDVNLEPLDRLRRQGVRITMAGLDRASLDDLRRLPLDGIRLEPGWVGALEHDPRSVAILRAVLSFAGSLGLSCTAAGVENRHQLDLLEREGCRVAQGSYFGPALHPDEIEAMIVGAEGTSATKAS